ncbi:MAG: peptidylprolyl isomerase [Clostridia bacterium]|nr:peptidylprolyl isomerase [Clostridia bacterium]
MKHRISALCAVLSLMLCCLCACGTETTPTTNTDGPSSQAKAFGWQLEDPAEGEEIAVMHTTKGDIMIRFFPEQAPKAVENFKTLAENGYYNGITFHRVIDHFMIQSGDPTATGSGGESCWGESFADEFDASLGNLRGSLSMANAGPNTNGSQFFINEEGLPGGTVADGRLSFEHNKDQLLAYGIETFEQFLAAQTGLTAEALTADVLKMYEEVGGNYHLDGPLRASGGHTVFGQVFEGMDVVDAISQVAVNDKDKPLEDVRIESIELMPYTAK